MDAEMLKLIGGGGSQIILAAGYIPVLWLIRTLWKERGDLQVKVFSMLQDLFADAEKRKELWDGQRQAIAEQTRAVAALAKEIEDLRDELRRPRP